MCSSVCQIAERLSIERRVIPRHVRYSKAQITTQKYLDGRIEQSNWFIKKASRSDPKKSQTNREKPTKGYRDLKTSSDRKRDLTIAILVEQGEGLLELRDLLIGELLRHVSSTQRWSIQTKIETMRDFFVGRNRSRSRGRSDRPRALRARVRRSYPVCSLPLPFYVKVILHIYPSEFWNDIFILMNSNTSIYALQLYTKKKI